MLSFFLHDTIECMPILNLNGKADHPRRSTADFSFLSAARLLFRSERPRLPYYGISAYCRIDEDICLRPGKGKIRINENDYLMTICDIPAKLRYPIQLDFWLDNLDLI